MSSGTPEPQVVFPNPATDPLRALARRLAVALGLLLVVALITWLGRDGYRDADGGAVSALDALYYASVSVTTTGYGDITPITPGARAWTALVVTPARVLFLIVLVGTTIEVLTPDFMRKPGALETVIAARPDVFNHNLETVPRLYPGIRPGARYFESLRLLQRVREADPSIFTKSGIMVGLGETRAEVLQVMDDMRSAEVDFLTLGQYLQPTPRHTKVIDFVPPATFNAYAAIARAKGFLLVASSPLTRSSYHAGDDFAKMKAAREAQLKVGGR